MRNLRVYLTLTLFILCISGIQAKKYNIPDSGAKQREPHQKLIKRIDCTQNYPANTYFSYGDVRIASSEAGKYREAEAKPLSRFGYRFSVKNVGKPHLAVVRYPDDKRRFMCMMDGTSYDLTIGTFTGVKQPLTHKMQEIKKVFWPRWNDCSIVFMTWGNGEPAAVADIQIYELNELPALNINKSDENIPARELGLQFEDPCGMTFSMGAYTEQEWLDRTVSYMHYAGQDLLTYPLVWYHGPLYPSECEPSGFIGGVAAPDRKIYARWTSHPADWVDILLKKFEKEGIQFQGALTLLRLGSLMRDMNINLDSIKAGKETYNNILANNQVQASTADWTLEYNVVNFEKQTNGTLDGWAYGEKNGPFGKGPMFNPLHPTVQKAILTLFGEIANRYGKSPAFKGISINMWHATILWYFSLKSGYDDYTIRLFEKETGIQLPVDDKDPERFSKRYQFLTDNHSEEWIKWRCVKIKDLFRHVRDTITSVRPDLRLTVTMWTETTIPGWFGTPDKPSQQIFARKSLFELYREGGFDVNMYKDEPGIQIDYSMVPSRDRDAWGTKGADTQLEKTFSFRDHDFLDKRTLDAVGKQDYPGSFIFDCWVEAWGKYSHSPCAPDDQQSKKMDVIWGKPAEGIRRDISRYPEDNFWWDSQSRITPHFQGGNYYLEYYAHSLAELDACRITRGGLFPDTGHSAMIQEFAKAYRVLPAKKFDTVGTTTDPVAVRSLLLNGKRYFYLVNREYYPVKVSVCFNTDTSQLVDLKSLEKTKVRKDWTLTLQPYELRSFEMPPDGKINHFSTTVPAEIIIELSKKLQFAEMEADSLRSTNNALPVGTEQLLSDAKIALKEERYAYVRHALDSYPVQKIMLLSKAFQGK
jgi:hypothetical protein